MWPNQSGGGGGGKIYVACVAESVGGGGGGQTKFGKVKQFFADSKNESALFRFCSSRECPRMPIVGECLDNLINAIADCFVTSVALCSTISSKVWPFGHYNSCPKRAQNRCCMAVPGNLRPGPPTTSVRPVRFNRKWGEMCIFN